MRPKRKAFFVFFSRASRPSGAQLGDDTRDYSSRAFKFGMLKTLVELVAKFDKAAMSFMFQVIGCKVLA